MSAALEQMGYALSPASCGRVMTLDRRLYGLDCSKKGAPRPKQEMPFKARFRHEWWSVDVRYLEKHRLPDPKPVYQITILENYSRAVIVSAISRTQDQWAYLKVLFSALSTAGIPKGIVSDGGKIFSSKQAMFVYNFLGIRKAQIEAGKPWQDYVETMFNVARRMADYKIEQAATWDELLAVHQRWVTDYNSQKHWAHRDRQDGRHSPSEVLGWVKGTMYPEKVLNRILFATRYTRQPPPLRLSALPALEVLWRVWPR